MIKTHEQYLQVLEEFDILIEKTWTNEVTDDEQLKLQDLNYQIEQWENKFVD